MPVQILKVRGPSSAKAARESAGKANQATNARLVQSYRGVCGLTTKQINTVSAMHHDKARSLSDRPCACHRRACRHSKKAPIQPTIMIAMLSLKAGSGSMN